MSILHQRSSHVNRDMADIYADLARYSPTWAALVSPVPIQGPEVPAMPYGDAEYIDYLAWLAIRDDEGHDQDSTMECGLTSLDCSLDHYDDFDNVVAAHLRPRTRATRVDAVEESGMWGR